MNQHKVAERLVWAVETLAVKPTDRLLEIGCGHGVAVSLVCEKLDGGCIIAIDRSPKMIAMAKRRNAVHVAAGRASFQTVSLHEADFGNARFDKIFAIRIGAFLQGNPTRELEVVKTYLASDGSFHLVYDPFVAAQAKDVIEMAAAVLENRGFTVKAVLTKDIAQTTVVCVIAGKR
jgi:cyclopropane fatty-acyl-phospholipid synthase-like methyltransferase